MFAWIKAFQWYQKYGNTAHHFIFIDGNAYTVPLNAGFGNRFFN